MIDTQQAKQALTALLENEHPGFSTPGYHDATNGVIFAQLGQDYQPQTVRQQAELDAIRELAPAEENPARLMAAVAPTFMSTPGEYESDGQEVSLPMLMRATSVRCAGPILIAQVIALVPRIAQVSGVNAETTAPRSPSDGLIHVGLGAPSRLLGYPMGTYLTR